MSTKKKEQIHVFTARLPIALTNKIQAEASKQDRSFMAQVKHDLKAKYKIK